MKKTLKVLLTFVLVIGLIAASPKTINASNDIKVVLEGKELSFDVPPQIIEGRTLLPLRTIFEALGLEVGWDDDTRIITGMTEGKEIILKLDSKDAKVNGVVKTLDVPAKAINGRTLVPVRFIAESLDMNIVWNQESKTVKISKDDIIEWKYEGYEGAYPHKEYERKYVNGVKSEETRYNGNNHEIKTVNLYSEIGEIMPNIPENKIKDFGPRFSKTPPLVGETYWFITNSISVQSIVNVETGKDIDKSIVEGNMFLRIKIDELKLNSDATLFMGEASVFNTHYIGTLNDKIKVKISASRMLDMTPDIIRFDRDPKTIFKWSDKVWNRIKNNEIWIGMTSDMFLLSQLVRPHKINRTVGKWGTHEQWVYNYAYSGDSYYYFENGVLSSWQD